MDSVCTANIHAVNDVKVRLRHFGDYCGRFVWIVCVRARGGPNDKITFFDSGQCEITHPVGNSFLHTSHVPNCATYISAGMLLYSIGIKSTRIVDI